MCFTWGFRLYIPWRKMFSYNRRLPFSSKLFALSTEPNYIKIFNFFKCTIEVNYIHFLILLTFSKCVKKNSWLINELVLSLNVNNQLLWFKLYLVVQSIFFSMTLDIDIMEKQLVHLGFFFLYLFLFLFHYYY